MKDWVKVFSAGNFPGFGSLSLDKYREILSGDYFQLKFILTDQTPLFSPFLEFIFEHSSLAA
jgi:hypothetical protein